MTTRRVPTRSPAPGRDARDGGWADAARRERRLQALQTTILIGLSLLVAVMALLAGRALTGSLADYRAEQRRHARLDELRFTLQEQEAALWRSRGRGATGIPSAVAATVFRVVAETRALAEEETRSADADERAAATDTVDGLDRLVRLVVSSSDLGAQGSAADRAFIARLDPMVVDLKDDVARWRVANEEELASANGDVSAATRRAVIGTAVVALLASLAGLLTWRLVGRARGRVVGELEAAHARLRHLADTDPLTGLANQRLVHDRLQVVTDPAAGDMPVGLVMADLDHFKAVNDTHGHPVGDGVLVETARRLRAVAGPAGLVARVGGEEFLMLLPGADGPAALAVAERARAAVRDTDYPGDVGRLTVSLGVATLAPGGDADAAMAEADTALYWAKTHGRDAAFLHTPALMTDLSPHNRARQLARADGLAALRALARAIDAKDPATQRHSIRVGDMAVMLATALGWSPERAARLREAGLVHDVGKIGVPDAVLLKAGTLGPAEREQMDGHARLGATIVSEVLDADQVEWVAHHHERWDGGGYPSGLGGEGISEGARILALADSWDAMTNRRGYNDPLTTDEALAECRRCSGSHFWPVAVEALERLHAAGAITGHSPVPVVATA